MKNNIIINEINDFSCLDESQYIFTTKVWLDFLQRDKKGTPLVLEVLINDKAVYFVSLLFKKGIKMCGSPFEGWNTPYMGFIKINELTDEEKCLVINRTIKYLKRRKHCWYIQICDWNINFNFVKKYKYKHEFKRTYFRDISQSNEELFSSFKNDVRTNHRAFIKNNLRMVISEATHDFVDNYYKQLIEVFEKRNLKPHYEVNKIYNLVDAFLEIKLTWGGLLLEDVMLPDENKSIAAGIFLYDKTRMYFFGAASYKEYQILRPNEEVVWNAIQYCKEKGCTEFDLIGLGKYKEKYKPALVEIPVLYFQKVPFLHVIKNKMKKKTFKMFKR